MNAFETCLVYDENTQLPVLINLNPWRKITEESPDMEGDYIIFWKNTVMHAMWKWDGRGGYGWSSLKNYILDTDIKPSHWKYLSLPPEAQE